MTSRNPGELTPESPAAGASAARPRVAVAMSGGVDSSVAAALLRDRGYDVLGLTMVTGSPRDWGLSGRAGAPQEPSPADCEAVAAARAAATQLAIPHHAVDLRSEFGSRIVRPFVEAYAAGFTPNPCVTCNAALKFGLLMEAAFALGAARFATGHYASAQEVDLASIGLGAGTGPSSRRVLLRRSGGPKDQTYALCLLAQEQLRRCLFPLDGLTKPEVREIARRRGLASAGRPESQDVCFLQGLDYRRFVSGMTAAPTRPGPVVDTSGRVLGSHQGLLGFTVGQRKGLGIGGPDVLYVLELRPESGELVVGTGEELMSTSLIAGTPVFAAFDDLPGPLEVEAAIRYRAAPRPARVRPISGGHLEVTFREPQRAVAPGQAVAFYIRDWLIGGAVISARRSTHPES